MNIMFVEFDEDDKFDLYDAVEHSVFNRVFFTNTVPKGLCKALVNTGWTHEEDKRPENKQAVLGMILGEFEESGARFVWDDSKQHYLLVSTRFLVTFRNNMNESQFKYLMDLDDTVVWELMLEENFRFR